MHFESHKNNSKSEIILKLRYYKERNNQGFIQSEIEYLKIP